MAFSYCERDGCGFGLEAATIDEISEGTQVCAAGHANRPNRSLAEAVAAALFDLTARVDALEAANLL